MYRHPKWLFIFLLSLVLLPRGTWAQQEAFSAKDEQAVQNTIKQFFTYYHQKDLTNFLSLWDTTSREFAPHAAAVKNRFDRATSQTDKNNFDFSQAIDRPMIWFHSVQYTDDAGVVLTGALVLVDVNCTQGLSRGWLPRAIFLVKRQGEWRIHNYGSESDMVVQLLYSFKSPADQKHFISLLAPIADKETGHGLQHLAEGYARRGEFQKAKSLFEVASELMSRRGDVTGAAIVHYSLGQLYIRHGDYVKSEKAYRAALDVFRKLQKSSHTWDEWRCYAQWGIGEALASQGREDDALPLLSEAAAGLKRLNEPIGVPTVETELGEIYSKNQPQKAISHFRTVCTIYDARQDLPSSAIAWQRLGKAYLSIDKYREARQCLTPAAYSSNQLVDEGAVADDHRFIGNALLAQGDILEAPLQLEMSKRLYIKVSHYESTDRATLLGYLNGLALTYTSLAQIHLANRHYSQAAKALGLALTLFQKTGNRYGAILAELRVEELESCSSERLERDIRWALQSPSTGFVPPPTQISSNVQLILGVQPGHFLSVAGDLTGILRTWQRISAMSKGNLVWQAASSLNLATVYYERRNFAATISSAKTAEKIAAQAQSPEIGWRAFAKEGQAQIRVGNVSLAVICFRSAINLIEQQRYYVAGEEEQRRHYLQDNTWLYQQLIMVLVSRHQGSDLWDALEYSERTKGRIVLDSLLRSPSSHYQSTYDALAQDEKPESMLSSQQLAALLPDTHKALLEFCLTDNHLILFVLTRSDMQHTASLRVYPLKRTGLEQDISKLYYAVGFVPQGGQPDPKYTEPARDMYQRLLLKAQTQLSGSKSMVIVPDGLLWNIPFPALVSSPYTKKTRHLIEDVSLSYAYSLTWLWQLQQNRDHLPKPPLDFVAFGNVLTERKPNHLGRPSESGATDPAIIDLITHQLQDDKRAYGGERRSQVFCGPQVTQMQYLRTVGKARVVQVTCHGMYYPNSPMASYLRLSSLSQGGKLLASDMLQTPLSAEMMILAACDTGRGQTPPGEGLIGMTWALARAGCRASIVSQWQIPFDSTGILTHDVHTMLAEQCRKVHPSLSKASILQKAMLQMLREPRHRYSHPYFWAAFMLVGDSGPMDRHWISKPPSRPVHNRIAPKSQDNVKLITQLKVDNPYGDRSSPTVEVGPGDIVSVKIFLGNSGTSVAHKVLIQLRLNKHLAYVPQSSIFYTKEDNQNVTYPVNDSKMKIRKDLLTWAYFDMPPTPTTAMYLYFLVRVTNDSSFRKNALGNIKQTLYVTASCSCLTKTVKANPATITVTRSAHPDVHCCMWAGIANLSLRRPKREFEFYTTQPATAGIGDTLWYEVLFANMGNSDIKNARIQVRLPSYIQFQGHVERIEDGYVKKLHKTLIEGAAIVGDGLVLPCLKHGNLNGQIIRFRVKAKNPFEPQTAISRTAPKACLVTFAANLYSEQTRYNYQGDLQPQLLANCNISCVIFSHRGLQVFNEVKDPTDGVYKPNLDNYLQEGQVLERRVFLQNNSRIVLRNVIVRVGLSAQLTYSSGSLAIDYATCGGLTEAGALDTGTQVTDMPPGFCQTVTFRELVNSNPTAVGMFVEPDIDVKTSGKVPVYYCGSWPKLIRQ